jgi:hypothetical protein
MKPGDKVRCVSEYTPDGLHLNEVYTIDKISEIGTVQLKELKYYWWGFNRFAPVNDIIVMTWPTDVAAHVSAACAYVLTTNPYLIEVNRDLLRIAYRDLQQAICHTKPGSDENAIRVAGDHGMDWYSKDGQYFIHTTEDSPLYYAWFTNHGSAARAYCALHKLAY